MEKLSADLILPEILEVEVVHKEKWLQINKTSYRIGENVHKWEWVTRTTKVKKGEVDGVEVFAFVYYKGVKVPKIVLIGNYRIPVKSYCLEFPAGLLDKDEKYETCGQRELKEETGYTGVPFKELNQNCYPVIISA